MVCLDAVAEHPAGCPGNAARCGAIFCRGCLVSALRVTRRCPACRAETGGTTNVDVATLATSAHAIASLIDELPVRCPYGVLHAPDGGDDDWMVAPDGCNTIVPRGQLAAHVASCPFELIGCAQASHGCGWRGARHSLTVHVESCWYERGREHLGRMDAELAKVRGEAAAQLETLRAEAAAATSQVMMERRAIRLAEERREWQKAPLPGFIMRWDYTDPADEHNMTIWDYAMLR